MLGLLYVQIVNVMQLTGSQSLQCASNKAIMFMAIFSWRWGQSNGLQLLSNYELLETCGSLTTCQQDLGGHFCADLEAECSWIPSL